VNKVAIEKVTTKIDPAKKSKHIFVPKMDVVQVGCSKPLIVEDPLITDMISSREETPNCLWEML